MRALFLGAALTIAGCFLGDPPAPPRYFAPAAPHDPPARLAVPVRLGIVRSPLHLRGSIAWRTSEVEFGFYDQRRWTELPSTYVERALERELFPTGTPVATAPDAPVLHGDVRAFEEVLAPVHEARVALAVELLDDRCIRLRRTFAASRPLNGDDPAALARGIGEALDEVVQSVGIAVRDALARRGRCGE